MNKFLKEMELDINKDNVVTKILGKETVDDFSPDLTSEFTKLKLDWIEFRPTNKYSMSTVDQLAEQIWEVGQLTPIIVISGATEEGKRYTLSDGEQRVRALQLCREKAIGTDKEGQFDYVYARILTREEAKKEQEIHRSANTYRTSTIFEIIARYEPTEDYFNSEENRNGYLKRANLEYAKFNKTDIGNDIYLRFAKEYPQYEVGKPTIVRYTKTVMALDDAVIMAVLKNKITVREAQNLETLSKEDQLRALKLIESGVDVKSAINQIIGNDKQQTPVSEEEIEGKELTLDSVGKQLSKTREKLNDILQINKKGFNGNQKEYLKQINKIFKEIEKLQNMPSK